MRKNRMLQIILIPGLDDGQYAPLGLLARILRSKSVRPHPMPLGWRDGGTYESKLAKLLAAIDELARDGSPVALIGTSAGGSMAINAFAKRPDLVGVVNVCGRLRAGSGVKPTLDQAAKTSRALRESVLACEDSQKTLSPEQRSRVLVMKPQRDQIVPLSTMSLTSAREHRVVGLGHVSNIVMAMLFYRRTMVAFLEQLKA